MANNNSKNCFMAAKVPKYILEDFKLFGESIKDDLRLKTGTSLLVRIAICKYHQEMMLPIINYLKDKNLSLKDYYSLRRDWRVRYIFDDYIHKDLKNPPKLIGDDALSDIFIIMSSEPRKANCIKELSSIKFSGEEE